MRQHWQRDDSVMTLCIECCAELLQRQHHIYLVTAMTCNDKIVGRNGGGFADTSVETSELQRFIFS